MLNVLKESAPSFPSVHRCVSEFKRGRTSIKNGPRSGRPKTATTPEIIAQEHNIVDNLFFSTNCIDRWWEKYDLEKSEFLTVH